MSVRKASKNKILINFITYSLLFFTFTNQCVFAAEDDTVFKILEEVAQVLFVIAGLLCLGKLIQIGIMYMTSSAVEKSQAKTALVPWLAGTVIAFGASVIGPAIIKLISKGFENTGPLDY